MPRGTRRGTRSGARNATAAAAGQADGGYAILATYGAPPTTSIEVNPERTAVFQKTKMCKFHILGACARGTSCMFAHDNVELNPLPDLSRTKLCKTLISTGSCSDPHCRYAHTKTELRRSLKTEFEEYPMQQGTWMPEMGGGHMQLHMMSEMAQQAMQMNQAAQAHAAEAARLHASVAQLQANVGTSSPYGIEDTSMYDMGRSLGEGQQDFVVRNTFVEVSEPGLYTPGRLRAIKTAAGRLDGNSAASTAAAEDSLGVAMTPPSMHEQASVPPFAGDDYLDGCSAWPTKNSEPVQINTGTLRSVSSNSLCAMAADEDGNDQAAVGRGALAASDDAPLLSGQSVEQRLRSFSRLEPPIFVSGRLRSIRSASGRLDALAEEDISRRREDTAMDNAPHRVLLPRYGSPRFVARPGPPSVSGFHTPLPDISREMALDHASSGTANWSAFCSPFVAASITEDAAATAPASSNTYGGPLRVVQTAAGRLDLMGGEAEDS